MEIRSPIKAIRAQCLECRNGNNNEVRLCPITDCPLYAFRFGKNPYRQKREYTEEQREQMALRLSLIRQANSKGKSDNGDGVV